LSEGQITMKLPKMVKIHQDFKTNSIQDIPGIIQSEFKAFNPEKLISAGQTVAITAGSRGIHKIDVITREIINCLKQIGAQPFIVPSMGSHGGATAEGQTEVLHHYGITKEAMGAPIKSSMAVVPVGHTNDGLPVFIDKIASQADHIIVVNRIKAHTDFEASIESGLMKMVAIGLGKQEAADKYHLDFVKNGYYSIITSVARKMLEKCNITFGVGVVENQKEETEIIKFIPSAEIEKVEEKLLLKAKQLFPRIPLSPIDLLIVDEMSKTYSGTGMDQNVIARSTAVVHNVPSFPKISRIFVRDLAAASNGNASGIGNADFTTQRLVDKIDKNASYVNVVTAVGTELLRIPIHFNTDREVMDTAAKVIPDFTAEKARVVRIKNTLDLAEMLISEVMIPEAEAIKNVRITGTPKPMEFDKVGNLR
jgi:hypothetical protein